MSYKMFLKKNCRRLIPGWRSVWAWLILWGIGSLFWISISLPEPFALSQGYTLLAQARMTPSGATQEQLLRAAVKAFEHCLQESETALQVQAMIGAAQSYMGMQTPIRPFPYLWLTAPLQLAAQHLQQALRLDPSNVAATLLLSLVSWRQALAFPAQGEDYLAHSRTLLNRVAALGLPVHFPGTEIALTKDAIPAFGVEDALITLQAVDARGTGHTEDWLLAYCLSKSEPGCFGMVFSAGVTYPLIADPATGAVVPIDTQLEGLTMERNPQGGPVIVAHGRQEQHLLAARFGWEGEHFALLTLETLPRSACQTCYNAVSP